MIFAVITNIGDFHSLSHHHIRKNHVYATGRSGLSGTPGQVRLPEGNNANYSWVPEGNKIPLGKTGIQLDRSLSGLIALDNLVKPAHCHSNSSISTAAPLQRAPQRRQATLTRRRNL